MLCYDDQKLFVGENRLNESRNQEFFVADALLGDNSKDSSIIITLTSRICLKYMKEQAEKCIPQFTRWNL